MYFAGDATRVAVSPLACREYGDDIELNAVTFTQVRGEKREKGEKLILVDIVRVLTLGVLCR